VTPVPPPASPCLRVKLDYTQSDGYLGGNRFFLSYAGAAPTAGNCVTLAGDIAAAWETDIAPIVDENWALTEVDVLDIATEMGASGHWTGSNAGMDSGTGLPAQCAVNVEYDILRRYRGGKPRIFLPPGTASQTLDAGHWESSYITSVNTQMAAFFAAIAALSVGAVGALAHVNLSYYSGFKNVTNSSGRERAVPQYRTAALVDPVTGYSCKGLIGSQRRRRNATTA
jgi:hypothetical protein